MINSDFLNSSTGLINAKVEFFDGSTLVQTCTCSDYLQDFNVDRVGDNSKFFGYGVCQKLSITLNDIWRELSIVSGNTVEISYISDGKVIKPYPTFKITEVNRDEDSNDISITAYDSIYDAENHEMSEVTIAEETPRKYAEAIAEFIGVPMIIVGVSDSETCFDTVYDMDIPVNIDNTEKLRDMLDDIAEITQTIYYINYENTLVFKRLDMNGDPVFTISKESYSVLKTSENRRLTSICHATELGDNVEASLDISGTTQYIRDNPFWDMRPDVHTLVDNALAVIGGFTIGQIRECEWIGNVLLEIGDKISFVAEDDSTITSYLLDDYISYDGFIEEKTHWEYTESDGETASNPTSLNEVLNQTYAKVDKANKEITLLTSTANINSGDISYLKLKTDSITTEVSSMKAANDEAIADTNAEITKLRTEIQQTSQDLTILIEEETSKDVDKVITSTGFKFDKDGLNISKSDSEMTTQITEDGMTVSRDGDITLTANNQGVDAINLRATTWLIIGSNSRFEDYTSPEGEKRTGCYWIGV